MAHMKHDQKSSPLSQAQLLRLGSLEKHKESCVARIPAWRVMGT